MHPAQLPEPQLLKDCRRENTRGSGPGGQHRNRVATAVRITHMPTGIMGQAYERRSQKDNARVAIFRLRLNIALEFRKPLDDQDFEIPYQPPTEWISRRKGTKIRVNPEHDDFPGLLAEVLDLLQIHQDDLPKVSTLLGISQSQLIKFLGSESRALHQLNERRKKAGMKPLRG
ncbi:MAG: peptide chain release factor-like protein [Planctomycetes bacterium]|nr:peptide chain release factor-like protein [Planctomycetota bacterium]